MDDARDGENSKGIWGVENERYNIHILASRKGTRTVGRVAGWRRGGNPKQEKGRWGGVDKEQVWNFNVTMLVDVESGGREGRIFMKIFRSDKDVYNESIMRACNNCGCGMVVVDQILALVWRYMPKRHGRGVTQLQGVTNSSKDGGGTENR